MVLILVSKLSMDDNEWLCLCSELLQNKQVIKALAVGLYFGSMEIKKKILFLAGTTSFSKECIDNLAKSLVDLSDLNDSSHCLESNRSPFPQPDLIEVPLFQSNVDGEGLNRVIEKLGNLLEKNEVGNASLASVIELYNFQLSEMRHAENTLRRSLKAADWSHGQLTRRVAHLGLKTSHLHGLLYSRQLALEGAETELGEVREQRAAAQEAASAIHIKLKQLKQDSLSKSLIVKEQNEEIVKLKSKIEEQNISLEEFAQNLKTVQDKKEDQDKLIKNLESRNLGLLTSNTQLEDKCKTHEKEIAEQKRLITNQTNQLLELERMRQIIFDITGGKKA